MFVLPRIKAAIMRSLGGITTALLLLVVLLLGTMPPAMAQTVLGQACPTFGATAMSTDGHYILACLLDQNASLVNGVPPPHEQHWQKYQQQGNSFDCFVPTGSGLMECISWCGSAQAQTIGGATAQFSPFPTSCSSSTAPGWTLTGEEFHCQGDIVGGTATCVGTSGKTCNTLTPSLPSWTCIP